MKPGAPEDRIKELDAMRMGTDYRFPCSIRGYSVVLRPLSNAETCQVAAEVMADLLKLPPSMQNPMQENTMLARRTLELASTSDVGMTDYKLPELVSSRMTNDELNFLFKQYVDVCDRVNPSLETLKPGELDKLVEALKKNPSERTELTRSQLLSLVSHFLSQPAD